MSTQELRLRYFIQLASNIGATSKREAQEYERAQERMTRSTKLADRSVKDLERSIGQLAHNSTVERQVRYFDRLAAGIDRARDKARQLKSAMAEGAQALPELAAMGAAGYYGGRAIMAPPLRAFANLEEATIALRTAMMDGTGKVDKAFGDIAKTAERLGNQLPGTTKDFFGSATELIRQGVRPELVAGGALEASSKFGVLMKIDQGQAARTIAKVREAYGLQANELPVAADLMQRASFQAGIDPQDFLDVARYAAPVYNTMGLTGIDNMRKLLAVQGMAAGVGLESTSFGTNFAQMLNRLSQIDQRVARNSPESKQVRELLSKHGIQLDFYGKDSGFLGIENMLEQLAKMRGLSTVDKQHIAKVMFGDEAGRPAQIMMDRGLEGYREALAGMDRQASLDQRLDSVLMSLTAKLEALGGTIEGVMARIAAPLGGGSKPILDRANGLFGDLGGYFEANPAVGTATLLGAGALGVAGAVRGSGALINMARNMASGGRAASTAATAARAAGAFNPFSGLGVAAPVVARSPSMMARLAGAGRFLGPGVALAGVGLESYDVMTDERLTAMGKAKGVAGAFAGGAGAFGGAKLGMMLGAGLGPLGILAGALIGGGLGYMGGKGLSSWALGSSDRDFVQLTAPGGAKLGGLQGGGQTTLQIGEGVLRVDVNVQSDGGVTTQAAMLRPMQLLRVEAGATDPGSFAGMAGRGF